jgi:hypothetical protein
MAPSIMNRLLYCGYFWGGDGFAYIGADVVILRNGGHCRCLCGYAVGWSVILEFAKGSEVDGRTMLVEVL